MLSSLGVCFQKAGGGDIAQVWATLIANLQSNGKANDEISDAT